MYESEISTRDACSDKRQIRDPALYRDLGERNVRQKSVIEKVYKKSAAPKGITKRSATKCTRQRMYDHMDSEYPSHTGKYVHPDWSFWGAASLFYRTAFHCYVTVI